jgi:hypothetical protein
LTAVGCITLIRTYFVCSWSRCRDSLCPLDGRTGLVGYISPYARRLLCLAGSSWSFDTARAHVQAFCGLSVSDELIRQITLGEGPPLEAWQQTAPEAPAAFAQAQGEVEFETDAVKVNTTEGWRDAKIGIFAKRQRGLSAESSQWSTRTLPKPTARWAFAAVEESQTFARRWGATAQRLGVNPLSADVTVLGDGADWIWNRAAEQFPNAAGVLDAFHAAEHIADASKAYLGEGPVAQEQSQRGRDRLLSDGYAGLVEWLGELQACPLPAGADGAALGAMMNYFAGHQERLNYAVRLHRGQSIGSGMVEGAAKNMIGRRLKANNARWLPANVNRMGIICSALYSQSWDVYWEKQRLHK